MENFFEQYGLTILKTFCATLCLSFLVFFAIKPDNAITRGITDSFYSTPSESTNESIMSQIKPTITLTDTIHGTKRTNIHIYPTDSSHNFKDDIILTDNGSVIPSSNVSYKILSTAWTPSSLVPGFYQIRYYYRAANSMTVTFVTTVVVHGNA